MKRAPLFAFLKDGGGWGGKEGGPALVCPTRVAGVGMRGSGGEGLAWIFFTGDAGGVRLQRENEEGGEEPTVLLSNGMARGWVLANEGGGVGDFSSSVEP